MRTHIRCIIVDDEPPAIRLLEKYIDEIPFLVLITSTTSSLEVLEILEKNEIDLIFLDIQMPYLTGIQLSKIIDGKTKVIFSTAFPQFALESYELGAIDYLLKPFEFERFYKAVLKAKAKFDTNKTIGKTKASLFVKTDGKNNFERINIQDILYIEGLKNYVAIHLKDKQVITYSTLKSIYESLPNEDFIQVHKSYILAVHHIEKTSTISVLINGKSLPLGQTYKSAFLNTIRKRKL